RPGARRITSSPSRTNRCRSRSISRSGSRTWRRARSSPRCGNCCAAWSRRVDVETPPQKVLVIDDDEKLLGAIRRLLTAAGLEVITSSSALHLPKLMHREKPDLVLLDIEMPALSGEHVLDLTNLFDF